MSTEVRCSRVDRVESRLLMLLGGFILYCDRLFATRSWARLLCESARPGIAGLDKVAGTSGISSMDSLLRTTLLETVDVREVFAGGGK